MCIRDRSSEIESAIRQNAGLVGEQMLDNSIADSDEAKVPDSPDMATWVKSVVGWSQRVFLNNGLAMRSLALFLLGWYALFYSKKTL